MKNRLAVIFTMALCGTNTHPAEADIVFKADEVVIWHAEPLFRPGDEFYVPNKTGTVKISALCKVGQDGHLNHCAYRTGHAVLKKDMQKIVRYVSSIVIAGKSKDGREVYGHEISIELSINRDTDLRE